MKTPSELQYEIENLERSLTKAIKDLHIAQGVNRKLEEDLEHRDNELIIYRLRNSG